MRVSEVAATMIPGWPLNVTLVTPVKWSPSIWIFVPATPEIGEKSVMNGPGPTTVNAAGLLLVPLSVLTVMTPLVAPIGTRVVIWVPAAFGVNSGALRSEEHTSELQSQFHLV